MKRFFTILLASVMILSTFAATIMDAAATTPAADAEELYLSDIAPKSATALSRPYYDQNEQGEPLLLNGMTYEKGIWTHPMPDREAESVYDISGYYYTMFYAIVGKEQKYVNALPGSLRPSASTWTVFFPMRSSILWQAIRISSRSMSPAPPN